MKILVLHTDLRVYWKRRLLYLQSRLKAYNIELFALEMFGKGSPYTFDPYIESEQWWSCLFPQNTSSDLSKSDIKHKLFQKLSELNPDIIVGGSIVFYSGALGLRWAKIHNKKFIMFDDAKPSDIKRNFFIQTIKNLITKQIDGVWLPSKDYENAYSFLKKQKVHFIYGYNCIDNDLFKYSGVKNFDNRKLICICRLVPIKNIHNLLQAWKYVEEVNQVDQLVIIGNGPLRKELVTLKDSLNLKRVEFVGEVLNDELKGYLNKADGFILPSWSESWGLVVNEAMAAGLPVLLSNKINAGNTLLKNAANGYVFDPADIQDIKEKIITYLDLPQSTKEEMSRISLERINLMNFDNMVKELLSGILFLKKNSPKKVGFLPYLLINLWSGRYRTSGWNTLDYKN